MEVSLNTEGGGFDQVADRVEYAALDLNAMASQQPPPPQTPPPTHDLGQKNSLFFSMLVNICTQQTLKGPIVVLFRSVLSLLGVCKGIPFILHTLRLLLIAGIY